MNIFEAGQDFLLITEDQYIAAKKHCIEKRILSDHDLLGLIKDERLRDDVKAYITVLAKDACEMAYLSGRNNLRRNFSNLMEEEKMD